MEIFNLPTSFIPKDKSVYGKFLKELLSIDDRIVVYCMIENEFDEIEINPQNHFYYPAKNIILIPCNIPSITHEICHMVTESFNRCLKPDWGFGKVNKVGAGPTTYSTPTFFASMCREITVRAIEKKLENKSIYEFGVWGKTLNELNFNWNEIWDPINSAEDSRFPFGKFKTKQDYVIYCHELAERVYNSWNEERVRFEWIKRINYIREHMEILSLQKVALYYIKSN